MVNTRTIALLATIAVTSVGGQVLKGFNYGSKDTNGVPISQANYEQQFKAAQSLAGVSSSAPFTAARLYTMIQGGSTNSPTAAIQAAINTHTKLLLGMWASGGSAAFANELAALDAAITQYGSAFMDLIVGISVGSEDLYRISPTGIINKSDPGAQPSEIVNYIKQVRAKIAKTVAASKPVGHVDTYTAWINGSNDAVVASSDFIGMDAYPYFQNTMANGIENGAALFQSAYDQTVAHAQGKPIWVTETGWPVSGKTENLAVPSTANAKTYWNKVGCDKLFNKVPTFWYTLQDAYPSTPNPSFGIIGAAGPSKPLFDLSCPAASSPSTPQSSSAAIKTNKNFAVQGNDAQANSPAAVDTPATTPQPIPQAAAVGVAVDDQSAVTVYTTLTTCPATTVEAGTTHTYMTTKTAVVTSCPGGCNTASVPATGSSSTGPSCPASLSGAYEYPHLIVPVNKDEPSKAYGTSYNGSVSSSISSIFNFDLPAANQDKTCSVVFFLPKQEQLTTSSYTLSGSGGVNFTQLQSPADGTTTYANKAATASVLGGAVSVTPGSSYVISSGPCAAGSRIGIEATATGSLSLNYFQDFNPSPIGLYITVC